MKTSILSLTLVSAALALGVSPADAVPIDFQSLTHADDSIAFHGTSYSEDGFTLSAFKPGGDPGGLYSLGTQHSNFTGSTALFNGWDEGVTELRLTGGGSFSLSSIDLAEIIGNGAVNVAFTGHLTGGGTVQQLFTLDGVAFGAQTFTFSGFGDVTKVRWSQDYPYHQFDNIVASANNGTPVPEPASLGLLGLGLAGLAWARRVARQQ